MLKYLSAILILFVLYSCTPTSKLKYAIDDTSTRNDFSNIRSEKKIQPYDYLYIKIYSLDQKTNEIFNADARNGGSQDEQLISYEVNDKGSINFPFVGDIYVKDLTIDEAKEKLEKELNQYLTNISIRVRFVGNKITILGEVSNPGNHTFFDEKITIFQAFGLANDISDYGDKTQVSLVREIDSKINYYKLDLTDKKIVESDFYYLLPNDILIVNPVKAKYRSMHNYSVAYLIFSGISAISTTIFILDSVNK